VQAKASFAAKKFGLDDNGQKKCPKPYGLGQIHLFRGWRRQRVCAKRHTCIQFYVNIAAMQQKPTVRISKNAYVY
jgi:hypothetical protein